MCSVLDAVDSQFALLTAALEKRRKELRVGVLERTQVRVHALMTQAVYVIMCTMYVCTVKIVQATDTSVGRCST